MAGISVDKLFDQAFNTNDYANSNDKKIDDCCSDFIIFNNYNFDIIDRYGSANAEFIKAYTGMDQTTDTTTRLSHKKIYGWKNDSGSSTHQQAGYSAEVIKVSRENARHIINGEAERLYRADDLDKFGINHPIYDHVEVLDGKVVENSGSQMKFVNNIKDKLIDNIAKGEGKGKNDWSRYLGAKLDIPSDQMNSERHVKECSTEIDKLKTILAKQDSATKNKFSKQLEKIENSDEPAIKKLCRLAGMRSSLEGDHLEKSGNTELAAQKRIQARNCNTVADNIRDSGITTDEAVFYREHPQLASLRDMAMTSHLAGWEGAKTSALGGAASSSFRNIFAYSRGDVDAEELIVNISRDTANAAIKGYATTALGSALKGNLEQLPPEIVQDMYIKSLKFLGHGEISNQAFMNSKIFAEQTANKGHLLAKTPIPGMVAGLSIEILPHLKGLFSGEISASEFATIMAQKTTSAISGLWGATTGAVVGNIIFPGLGGLVGGYVGSCIASILCNTAFGDLARARLAKQNLEIVKSRYFKLHRIYEESLKNLQIQYDNFYNQIATAAKDALASLEKAAQSGSVCEFEIASQKMASTLNCKLSHPTFASFKQSFKS